MNSLKITVMITLISKYKGENDMNTVSAVRLVEECESIEEFFVVRHRVLFGLENDSEMVDGILCDKYWELVGKGALV